MDLKLMATAPTDAERAAVDGVLGPPASGWSGGVRSEADLHIARGGHAARARRHLLLPALWALADDIGWISPGGLNYVCERLTVPPAEAYGVASFYALFSVEPRPGRVAHVCDDVACRAAGAEELCAALEQRLGPAASPDGGPTWERSPCLGLCDRAPGVLYQIAGGTHWSAGAATAEKVATALGAGVPGPGRPATPQITEEADGSLRLLRRVGVVDPASLDSYRAAGGYQALAKAVAMTPAAIIEEVTASGLLGRGGAAFPTGRKWAAVAAEPTRPRYLICNADESEPGTFKDRLLLEADPFTVVEAMTIAAFATGCEQGYLYIRGEYPEATRTMVAAISQVRQAGMLGGDVMGAGFSFDVEIRRGAGAYICGEETALMESIEGKRGEPRQKPPFPTQSGLFGKPTVINNVETLANVPGIIEHGARDYRSIGTEQSSGTRLFCVSGAVSRPGVFEVEMGTSLRELLELAGGVDGELQAILLGGAAGSFVTDEALDLPLAFEDARRAGVSLGSGAVVVFDRTTDMTEIVARIARFFRDESCGQCVPCRVGTVRQEEALARLARGGDRGRDLGLLADIDGVMTDASICGLGQTAASAVRSAIDLGLVGS